MAETSVTPDYLQPDEPTPEDVPEFPAGTLVIVTKSFPVFPVGTIMRVVAAGGKVRAFPGEVLVAPVVPRYVPGTGEKKEVHFSLSAEDLAVLPDQPLRVGERALLLRAGGVLYRGTDGGTFPKGLPDRERSTPEVGSVCRIGDLFTIVVAARGSESKRYIKYAEVDLPGAGEDRVCFPLEDLVRAPR